MELNHLPIIDWDLSTKLAGNKREFAEEMLGLFVKDSHGEISTIKQLYLEQNYAELSRRVHRLHGALCYCGLPRLKRVVKQLETALRNNIMVSLPSHLNQLESEINLLLEHHSSLNT